MSWRWDFLQKKREKYWYRHNSFTYIIKCLLKLKQLDVKMLNKISFSSFSLWKKQYRWMFTCGYVTTIHLWLQQYLFCYAEKWVVNYICCSYNQTMTSRAPALITLLRAWEVVEVRCEKTLVVINKVFCRFTVERQKIRALNVWLLLMDCYFIVLAFTCMDLMWLN